MRRRSRKVPVLLALAAMMVFADAAAASMRVAKQTSRERLKVNSEGVAMVYYRQHGSDRHVAFWGAKNVRPLVFKLDRSGGLHSGKGDYRTFRNTCGTYTGPPISYAVEKCTATDGTHWTLQKWRTQTRNASGLQGKKELRISHFTGETAKFEVWGDWSWSGTYAHMIGTLSYKGKPWYATEWKSNGVVIGDRGRNIAIDSYGSDIGKGWQRVNAILSHYPSGQFCYGFTPKGTIRKDGYSPTGRYRVRVPGPGVTPDIFKSFRGKYKRSVVGVGPLYYSPLNDDFYNSIQAQLVVGATYHTSCSTIN